MTKFIATTVLAISAMGAATAHADPYDGSMTPAAFAAAHFANDHEAGDGPRGRPNAGSSSVAARALALRHFAQSSEPGERRNRYGGVGTETDVVISTIDNALVNLARAKLDNDERGDN